MKGEFYKKVSENAEWKSYVWFDYTQVGQNIFIQFVNHYFII
jgi:hypothetical protein